MKLYPHVPIQINNKYNIKLNEVADENKWNPDENLVPDTWFQVPGWVSFDGFWSFGPGKMGRAILPGPLAVFAEYARDGFGRV